jgi:hypothetical protein
VCLNYGAKSMCLSKTSSIINGGTHVHVQIIQTIESCYCQKYKLLKFVHIYKTQIKLKDEK